MLWNKNLSIVFMKVPTQNKLFIPVAIFVVVLLLAALFFWSKYDYGQHDDYEKYVKTVMEACAGKAWKPSCYDTEIPKLLGKISMEAAFEVTRMIQKKDPAYLYCHVLAHNIASRETAKDPSHWMDVIPRCPMTMCNNGCPHGALMERFKSESLTSEQVNSVLSDLANACEPRGSWHPLEIERSMCYHGLGHLAMYITDADINKAADVCEDIGVKSDGRNYIQTCTEGVYMSIYQPLEPEDFALVKGITPKKEELKSFCSKYVGQRRDICWREGWPLYREELTADPKKLVTFCGQESNEIEQKKCYGTALNFLTVQFVMDRGDNVGMEAYCNGLPRDLKRLCFANVARRLVQIDPQLSKKALGFCNEASKTEDGDECYKTMAEFGSWTFRSGSAASSEYCDLFPEIWQKVCRFAGSRVPT